MPVLLIILFSVICVQYSFAQYYQPAPPIQQPSFDFNISSNPSYLSIVAGQASNSIINIQLATGNSTNVELSCSPSSATLNCHLDGGQTASITPGGSATLSVQTSQNTSPGSYTVTVTGIGGGQSHSTIIEVTVTVPPSPQPPPSTTPGTAPPQQSQGYNNQPPGQVTVPNQVQLNPQPLPPGAQGILRPVVPSVPSWVKNNAKWWSEGQISQDEFLKGIQYLVQNRIINSNSAPPSFAQMQSNTISSDCYIKIDGITGEYNAADLSGAVKVILFYWRNTQSQESNTSPSHQIYFVKLTDKASPQISLAIQNGQHFNNAQLECRKAGGEQYLSYTMNNVIISSISQISNRMDIPAEKVGLDFASSQTVVDTYNMTIQNQSNHPPAPPSTASTTKPAVPSWIKNNAKWWSEGQISQDEFLKGIQYLVQNNIIIPAKVGSNLNTAVQVAVPDCSLRGPGVNLRGCFLYQVNMANADFTGANLNGATISSSNLMGIKLTNADLTGSSIEGSDVSSSDMSNAKTGGLFFNNADIRFANFHGDDLSKVGFSMVHFSFDDLTNTNLSNVYLQHFDFSFANMGGTNLSFADLSYSTLYDADLTNAKLSCINLFHGDLRGAKLVGASFDDGNTHQRCVDLDQADLSEADLTNAYLSGADLPGANLSNAILTNADLSNTDLDGADLTGADLTGANLNYASLKGCIGYSGCH